jgi:type IV secretion system protein TrbJ
MRLIPVSEPLLNRPVMQRFKYGFILLVSLISRAGHASVLATEYTQILNNLELVAAYAEQAEQTLAQLNQYQLMLRNLMNLTPDDVLEAAAQQLWRNREMAAAFESLNTLVKAGRKLKMTARNTGRIFRTLHPGYGSVFDFKHAYRNGSDNALNALERALTVMGAQAQRFSDEEQLIRRLRTRSQTARGQMQALQAGNEIGVALLGQMQQLRQLHMAQLQAHAHFTAAQQDALDAQHHSAERVLGDVQSQRLRPLHPIPEPIHKRTARP